MGHLCEPEEEIAEKNNAPWHPKRLVRIVNAIGAPSTNAPTAAPTQDFVTPLVDVLETTFGENLRPEPLPQRKPKPQNVTHMISMADDSCIVFMKNAVAEPVAVLSTEMEELLVAAVAPVLSTGWGDFAKINSPIAKTLSKQQNEHVKKYGTTGQVPL
jgi:hypothetical protein